MEFNNEQELLVFAELLNSFGKELTCPIWWVVVQEIKPSLSLLRESTRLPCNHYFCRYSIGILN